MNDFIVHTDGGARGNPGLAGAGVVIEYQNDEPPTEFFKTLGVMTNNQAEYWAIVFALESILERLTTKKSERPRSVQCFLDSELIVQQLNGNYKVKHEGLLPLYRRVNELVDALELTVIFKHIPRRENKRADMLANRAMDELERGK